MPQRYTKAPHLRLFSIPSVRHFFLKIVHIKKSSLPSNGSFFFGVAQTHSHHGGCCMSFLKVPQYTYGLTIYHRCFYTLRSDCRGNIPFIIWTTWKPVEICDLLTDVPPALWHSASRIGLSKCESIWGVFPRVYCNISYIDAMMQHTGQFMGSCAAIWKSKSVTRPSNSRKHLNQPAKMLPAKVSVKFKFTDHEYTLALICQDMQ